MMRSVFYGGYEYRIHKGTVPSFGKPRYLYHPKHGWTEVAVTKVRNKDGKFHYKVDEGATKKVEERPLHSCVLPRQCPGKPWAEKVFVSVQERTLSNRRAIIAADRYKVPIQMVVEGIELALTVALVTLAVFYMKNNQ